MNGMHLVYDGSNTAFRANMVSEMSTKDGFRTAAIAGTLNITHSNILQLQKDLDLPVKQILFAWDLGHSARRKEIFPEYKVARKERYTPEDQDFFKEFYEQIKILHESLSIFGIKSFRKSYWEGDDLIYGLTLGLKKRYPDDMIVIVSTDEDFHQLIDDHIVIFSPIKKILYTYDNYKDLMGIRPELYISYKILKGDSSDGIPGIAGIGEKTAKSIVNQFGALPEILDHFEELSKSRRTARIFTKEGLEILDRNNKLINLKEYVTFKEIQSELDAMLDSTPEIDRSKIIEFFKKFQMVSMLVNLSDWIQPFIEVVQNFQKD